MSWRAKPFEGARAPPPLPPRPLLPGGTIFQGGKPLQGAKATISQAVVSFRGATILSGGVPTKVEQAGGPQKHPARGPPPKGPPPPPSKGPLPPPPPLKGPTDHPEGHQNDRGPHFSMSGGVPVEAGQAGRLQDHPARGQPPEGPSPPPPSPKGPMAHPEDRQNDRGPRFSPSGGVPTGAGQAGGLQNHPVRGPPPKGPSPPPPKGPPPPPLPPPEGPTDHPEGHQNDRGPHFSMSGGVPVEAGRAGRLQDHPARGPPPEGPSPPSPSPSGPKGPPPPPPPPEGPTDRPEGHRSDRGPRFPPAKGVPTVSTEAGQTGGLQTPPAQEPREGKR